MCWSSTTCTTWPSTTSPGPDGGGSDTLRVDDGFAASLSAVGRPESVTFVFSESSAARCRPATHSYAQQVALGIENVVLTGLGAITT